MPRILVIPGLSGSGPDHWQSRLEALDGRCVRVEQDDWDAPALETWIERLDEKVRESDEPAVLVAHSLGCVLAVHWAHRHYDPRVAATLLVAPADVERPGAPAAIRGFAPLLTATLPFPSVVMASRDDEYMDFGRAEALAASWGARFVDAGAIGHINAASGLGTFPAGREQLRGLLSTLPFDLSPRLASDTLLVGESPLNLLLLMNERRYPWLILVPKRAGVEEAFQLCSEDAAQLAHESALVAKALWALGADKVNVGALGNVVRQLHVHHVARSLGDAAWPGPVWGHSPRTPYADGELLPVLRRLAGTALRERFDLREPLLRASGLDS